MLFFFVHWVFMGIIEQNLETNTLLTHNNALEKNLSTGRLLDPWSCNGICLDPSCPRTTDQLEPAEEVKGVWKARKRAERAKVAQKRRHFQFNWKRFGIIPK